MSTISAISVIPHAISFCGAMVAGYTHAKTGITQSTQPYVFLIAPTLATGLFSVALSQYNRISLENTLMRKQMQLAEPTQPVISGIIYPHVATPRTNLTVTQLQDDIQRLESKVATYSSIKGPLRTTSICAAAATAGYLVGNVFATYF